jgi:hypothetical protein
VLSIHLYIIIKYVRIPLSTTFSGPFCPSTKIHNTATATVIPVCSFFLLLHLPRCRLLTSSLMCAPPPTKCVVRRPESPPTGYPGAPPPLGSPALKPLSLPTRWLNSPTSFGTSTGMDQAPVDGQLPPYVLPSRSSTGHLHRQGEAAGKVEARPAKLQPDPSYEKGCGTHT